jgi:hypothetical protein
VSAAAATGDAQAAALAVSDKGIALASDLKDRFGNYYPSNFNPVLNASRGGGNLTAPDGTRLTVRQDERFVNWMRTAALPRFRKLWGRIDGFDGARTALEPGDVVVVNVVNRWNTYSFDGQKAIVLVGAPRVGGGPGGAVGGERGRGARSRGVLPGPAPPRSPPTHPAPPHPTLTRPPPGHHELAGRPQPLPGHHLPRNRRRQPAAGRGVCDRAPRAPAPLRGPEAAGAPEEPVAAADP